MSYRTLLFAKLSLLLVASTFACQARADLIGSQVTANVRLPTINDIQSNTATATVGPGIEYPDGTFTTLGPPYFVIPVDIDLAASTITATYNANVVSAPGAFNGYVFDFTGLNTPILAAVLDPGSSFSTSQVGVGFSANEVTINLPSLSIATGNIIQVDLAFEPTVSTVPEPSSIALLGSGAGALLGLCRKRRSA
jgi:hypothetical protein